MATVMRLRHLVAAMLGTALSALRSIGTAAAGPPLPHRPSPFQQLQLPSAPPWPELAATPAMGYNGWLAATMSNQPGAKKQSIYYRIADQLVETELAAAGESVSELGGGVRMCDRDKAWRWLAGTRSRSSVCDPPPHG